MTLSEAYWPTIAQTIPVFAFALVVEARAISRSWKPGELRAVRVFQSALWGASLVLLGFGENAALTVLSGGSVATWWPRACNTAISATIGVLLLAPALELVAKGHAEWIAVVLTQHPVFTAKRWWVERFARREIAKMTRRIERAQAVSSSHLEQLDAIEATLAAKPTGEVPEEVFARLAEFRADLMQTHQDGVDLAEEIAARPGELTSRLQELRHEVMNEKYRAPRRRIVARLLGKDENPQPPRSGSDGQT